MELKQLTKEQRKEWKALYREAFPKQERIPFWFLCLSAWRKRIGMYSVLEQNRLCGLLIGVEYQDLLFLDYLAVKSSERGRGIGSGILRYLQERYPEKRIFLEIETLSSNVPNAEQRNRRVAFYQRNGLKLQDTRVLLFHNDFSFMSCHGEVSFKEYA